MEKLNNGVLYIFLEKSTMIIVCNIKRHDCFRNNERFKCINENKSRRRFTACFFAQENENIENFLDSKELNVEENKNEDYMLIEFRSRSRMLKGVNLHFDPLPCEEHIKKYDILCEILVVTNR